MSFNPLNEQAELECSGAPVLFVFPFSAQAGWLGPPHGVPGGPFTSPANAPLALAATSTAAEMTSIKSFFMPNPLFVCRRSPSVWREDRTPLQTDGQRSRLIDWRSSTPLFAAALLEPDQAWLSLRATLDQWNSRRALVRRTANTRARDARP